MVTNSFTVISCCNSSYRLRAFVKDRKIAVVSKDSGPPAPGDFLDDREGHESIDAFCSGLKGEVCAPAEIVQCRYQPLAHRAKDP